jgi:hypothetical protein
MWCSQLLTALVMSGVGEWEVSQRFLFIAGYAVASQLEGIIGYPFWPSMVLFSDVGVDNGLVGVGDCVHTVCLPPPTSPSVGKAAGEGRHTTTERETKGPRMVGPSKRSRRWSKYERWKKGLRKERRWNRRGRGRATSSSTCDG